MSIAAQCPDCCACPTPTTQWDSRSSTLRKRGWRRYDGVLSDIYLTISGSGSTTATTTGSSTLTLSGSTTVDPITRLLTGSTSVSDCNSNDVTTDYAPSFDLTDGEFWPASLDEARPPGYMIGDVDNYINSTVEECVSRMSGTQIADQDGISSSEAATTQTSTGTGVPVPTSGTPVTYTGARTFTLSNPYLTATLISNAIASLPAYDDDWNDTAGSFRNVSTDELSVAVREARYRFRFEIPKIGSGTCYRLTWVERFIAEAGVALTSAEIVTRGVYRPTVTSSGGGGTGGLVMRAVMASDGSVSAVNILNPGDFNTAPTITVQSAINGGTTSTGWTATLTGRQVTAVTRSGGTAGNYLPTGAFSGGGGSGATITFTMDATGGLATSPLGATGSAYTSAPTLTITPKVSGSIAALVHLHLGTEEEMCAEWDGVTPEDYDPEDPSTYPIIGGDDGTYFELPVPSSDGTTLVANQRAFCDCLDCESIGFMEVG